MMLSLFVYYSLFMVFLSIFVLTLFSVTTLLNCANNDDLPKSKKSFWILMQLLFWGGANLIYGMTQAKEGSLLRKFSWFYAINLLVLLFFTFLLRDALLHSEQIQTALSLFKTQLSASPFNF